MCSSSRPSSLSSSNSGYGLIVEGIPLGSGGQFMPRLTMKRIYNTKCFRPERYRHEVANHYRDYKLQQHLHQQHHHQHQRHRGGQRRRQRRRQLFGGAASEASRVSPASLASQYAQQFRDVFPTHRHYFPRSNDTTSSSTGGVAPPHNAIIIYNDAVRRIRSAHSCEQLRQLVQRQLQRHRLTWRSNNHNDDDDDDEALATNQGGGSQSSDQRNDYKLNNIHKHKRESPQRLIVEEQRQVVDFYAYLQLASGYYERGLQADLKYLQTIGQQKKQHKREREREQQEQHHRLDLEVDRRLTGRLVRLLKSLRGKAAASQKQAGHPAFKVDIRSVKREQEPETDLEESSEQEDLDSMCDYYAQGGTLATATEAAARVEDSTRASVASVATAAHQKRLYEIIDNLNHLSIAGETAGGGGGGAAGGGAGGGAAAAAAAGEFGGFLQLTLPQITLTDCSTTAQQVALYSNSIVTLQMRPEPSQASI